MGGAPIEFDEWAVDFLLTGSQKALALPPGLALGVASDRALARAASIPVRSFYFDLVGFERRAREDESIARLVEGRRGLRIPQTPNAFEGLVGPVSCFSTNGEENQTNNKTKKSEEGEGGGEEEEEGEGGGEGEEEEEEE